MHRLRSFTAAAILITAAPFLLSLPAVFPEAGGLLPFLAGVASLYLGLQFFCGDLAEV